MYANISSVPPKFIVPALLWKYCITALELNPCVSSSEIHPMLFDPAVVIVASFTKPVFPCGLWWYWEVYNTK